MTITIRISREETDFEFEAVLDDGSIFPLDREELDPYIDDETVFSAAAAEALGLTRTPWLELNEERRHTVIRALVREAVKTRPDAIDFVTSTLLAGNALDAEVREWTAADYGTRPARDEVSKGPDGESELRLVARVRFRRPGLEFFAYFTRGQWAEPRGGQWVIRPDEHPDE